MTPAPETVATASARTAAPEPRRTAPAAAPPSPLRLALFFLMALTAGAMIPLQGRINARLAAETGDPALAGAASFAVGLAALAVITPLTPWGRRGLARVPEAFRTGRVKWWYLLAGTVGGFMVLSQTVTIGVIGVAVYTVAVVVGQLVGGMVVDRAGLSPAGVKRLTPQRIAGGAIALVAVVLVVAPQLGGMDVDLVWLLMVLGPLAVGLATSLQHVFNARQSTAYGSAMPGTLFNFVAGTGILTLIALVGMLAGSGGGTLPGTWWLYLGGPMGAVFIGFSALLVPKVGAFMTMLGLVSGKLLGSLAVDLALPTPGSVLSPWTVVGTLVALGAVVLASASGTRGRRRRHPAGADGQGRA